MRSSSPRITESRSIAKNGRAQYRSRWSNDPTVAETWTYTPRPCYATAPVVIPLYRYFPASTMSNVPSRNRPRLAVTVSGAMISEGLMNESLSFSGSPSK